MPSTAPGLAVRVGLVVVAAGSGSRLGATEPKAFVELLGRSLLEHVLIRLAEDAHEVVVVVPPGHVDRAQRLVDACGVSRPTAVVPGGATRTASVSLGLSGLGSVDVVAVHDAARPLVDAGALHRAVAAVLDGADAAAPAVELADTIKQVGRSGDRVEGTVDRALLRAVQTPQVFRADVLRRVHAAGGDATDDLALVEQAGGQVRLVPGDVRYLKITHADDLIVAAALAEPGAAA